MLRRNRGITEERGQFLTAPLAHNMEMTMKIFRQGDVLLVETVAVPAEAKDMTPDDRIVLAHGEVTGHAHAIVRTKEPARYFDSDAERFLRVLEKTVLTHEEHSAVILDRGIYKQAFQVEEKREEIKRVED